jgi:hypothetical protein
VNALIGREQVKIGSPERTDEHRVDSLLMIGGTEFAQRPVGFMTLRGSSLQICPVLLNQVRLKGRSNFVGGLEPAIDRTIARSVVNHAVSTPG